MAMNKERMLQLADRIEKLGEGVSIDGLDGFNMADWWCGTVGCIAGACYALRIEEGKEKPDTFFDTYHDSNRGIVKARTDLGLTEAQAHGLFGGSWEGADNLCLRWITAQEAAQALRDIAEGRLVWKRGVDEHGHVRYMWRRAEEA